MRNAEMGNRESTLWISAWSPRWSHRRRAVEKSSKRQAPFWSLGHGESRRLFTESPKHEMQNACSELAPGHNLWSHRRRLEEGASATKLHFRVSGIMTWSVKKLHHRNTEMPKSRNAKCRYAETPKCENAEKPFW
jgi:hypothetical protein